MNLHFPLPKIRTIGDELTLSLAKNSHFSFLPSHFLSLPSRDLEVTIVALKWGLCALHHWIKSSMEAILAWNPAVSTEWLAGWHFPVYYDVCARPPFAMSSHFTPLPKFFFALFAPWRVFQMARAARRVIENPRQMIKSCPVLFCSSHRKNESN